MKKLLLLSALIFSLFTALAGPVRPCYDDATIPSYGHCYYVTFTAVCCDGVTRSGYLGSIVASGTPNIEGLKCHVASQIGCIPKNVRLSIDSNISLAEYKVFFNGRYGRVIINKPKP